MIASIVNINRFKNLYKSGEFVACKKMFEQFYTPYQVFESCLNSENLEISNWILENFPDKKEKILTGSFNSSCIYGNQAEAGYILKIFPSISVTMENILDIVSTNNLDFFRWIVKKHKEEIEYETVLKHAVTKGSFGIIKYLYKENPYLTITADIYELFHLAVYNNYIRLCRWFHQKFEIDITHNGNEFLVLAINENLIDLAQWIWDKGGNHLTDEQQRNVFLEICKRGELTTLNWFIRKFPNIDVHANNEKAFYIACFYYNHEIIDWLYKTHPDINVRVNNDEIFREAVKQRNMDICEWFEEKFPDLYSWSEEKEEYYIKE